MSERKVLNKYYPPDFDPSKIPKLREPKNKTFSIRIMAPFNMRCNVCGEYIYKGKKFNSRKENVDDEDFLGLRIFRFYIRCPKCVAEIAFKTDLKNTDYSLEAGATRLFEAERLAQAMAEQERLEKEAEELNPMTVLENRTKASHKEMAQIDQLEELREINSRHAKIDTDTIIEGQKFYEQHLAMLQKEEEDEIVENIFGSKTDRLVKRLADSDSDDELNGGPPKAKKRIVEKGTAATDLLTDSADGSQTATHPEAPKKVESWQKSVGTLSSKSSLANLVRKKPANTAHFNTTSNGMNNNTNKPSSSSSSANGASPSSSVASTETQRLVAKALCEQAKAQSAIKAATAAVKVASAGTAVSGSALGLLGDYSDSDSNASSD